MTRDERDTDIIALFLSGASYQEISKRIAVSTRVISGVLQEKGVRPVLTPAQIRQAENLWFRAFSTFEISRKLLVSEAAVHNSACAGAKV